MGSLNHIRSPKSPATGCSGVLLGASLGSRLPVKSIGPLVVVNNASSRVFAVFGGRQVGNLRAQTSESGLVPLRLQAFRVGYRHRGDTPPMYARHKTYRQQTPTLKPVHAESRLDGFLTMPPERIRLRPRASAHAVIFPPRSRPSNETIGRNPCVRTTTASLTKLCLH